MFVCVLQAEDGLEAVAVIARVLRRRNKEGSKSNKGSKSNEGSKDGDVDATGMELDFLDPPDAILMDRYSFASLQRARSSSTTTTTPPTHYSSDRRHICPRGRFAATCPS